MAGTRRTISRQLAPYLIVAPAIVAHRVAFEWFLNASRGSVQQLESLAAVWLSLLPLVGTFVWLGRRPGRDRRATEPVEIPDGYSVEPELHAPPRAARVRASAQALLAAVAILMVGWLLAATALAYRDVGDLWALADRGEHTEAQVIGREIVERSERRGRVYYAFATNAGIVRSHIVVRVRDYPQYPTGLSLPITYLRLHPQVHRVGPVPRDRVRNELLAWLLGIPYPLAWLGCLAWMLAINMRRELRLARLGVAAAALVTDALARQRTVRYAFQTAEGAVYAGAAVVNGRRKIRAGDVLTVLYDPADPADNRPYRSLGCVAVDPAPRARLRLSVYRQ